MNDQEFSDLVSEQPDSEQPDSEQEVSEIQVSKQPVSEASSTPTESLVDTRGVSIPMLVASVLGVAALVAGFFTLSSLRSDLSDQTDQVEALEAQVAELETAVQTNSNSLDTAVADLESQAALQATALNELAAGQASASGTTISTAPEGSLPPFAGNGEPDGSIGLPAPDISGQDFLTGDDISIVNGAPTMVMVWAHWCPHCQRELPVVQDLYDRGEFANRGVELVTLATFEDPSRSNPFEEYVQDFTFPVLRDTDGSSALLGLNSVPSWVFIDADGTVLGRISGAFGEETLLQVIDQIAAA